MTPVVSKPYMIQPKATDNNENICIVPYKVCACLLHSKQVFVSGNNNKKAWRTNPQWLSWKTMGEGIPQKSRYSPTLIP